MEQRVGNGVFVLYDGLRQDAVLGRKGVLRPTLSLRLALSLVCAIALHALLALSATCAVVLTIRHSKGIARHDGNEQTCYYREKKVPLLHSVFFYFFMRYFMRFNASLTTCSTGIAAFSSSNALTTLAEGAGEKPSMVRADTASSMTSLFTATVLPPSPMVTS